MTNNQKIRPYVLAESNWKHVKETDFKVVVLPWGATEAHNYHLPYATDNYQAEYVAVEAAKITWENGVKIVVLPTVPFGVNTGQMDVDLCINMNPTTQLLVLKDIVHVLSKQGIQKLVIVNSHGGNNFKQTIRELTIDYPDVFVCSLNWWQVVQFAGYFDDPGDHAGELETSAMLHIKPDCVLPLSEAGDGAAKKFKVKGLKDGWVSAQRQWTSVTKDTGVGDPALASKEKGAQFLKVVVNEIGDFLTELAGADLNDMYE